MEGLSRVCQYPRCAKKALFCCEKCLKRTYCSEKCQMLDWEEHKLECCENEKRVQIIKEINEAKEKYGDVFNKPRQRKSNEPQTGRKQKKPESKRAKIEIEYNGSLLPHCLEVLNNSMVSFFDAMESNEQFGSFCEKKKNELYHTSSVTETVDILQRVLNHIGKVEKHACFQNREVSESIREMMKVMIELADHFKLEELKKSFESVDFYDPCNDYKCTTEERHFCTHCGDNKDLVDHPALRYVFLCKPCLEQYNKNTWEKEDDHDVECYCCGDGGNVVLCDSCKHSICSNCIMLHMGIDEWENVMNEEKWECLACKKDEAGNKIFDKLNTN